MSHQSSPEGQGSFGRTVGWLMLRAYNVYILVTLIGWAGIGLSLKYGLEDPWIARIIVASAGSLLVVLLVGFIYIAVSLGRKARYSQILVHLQEMLIAVRELQSQMRSLESEETENGFTLEVIRAKIEKGFERVLTQVVMAFGITSGTSCRASIKFLGQIDSSKKGSIENLYVRTVARDSISAPSCAEKDSKEERTHHISKNTDFERLIKGECPYFFSDNVRPSEDYQNSSLPYWTEKRPIMAYLNRNAGFLSWGIPNKALAVLPYTSVLVSPIRGAQSDSSDREFVGFFCVDSLARKAFDERYDAHLCATVADALYHPLLEYGKLMTKIREKLRSVV